MTEEFDIPKHAAAGVAFLGVELSDATIVLFGLVLGLGAFLKFGAIGFIGCTVGGFFLNKAYLEWREGLPAGQVRARLFRAGLRGYSKAFKGGDVVFVGDGTVINPDSGDLLDRLELDLQIAEVAKAAGAAAKSTPAASSPSTPVAASPLWNPEVSHGT